MEESATSPPSSIWSSVNSWFTSTVFFILLNLMIATIVFTSNLPNNNQQTNHHQQQEEEEEEEQKQNSHHDRNQPQIARSPSILHRIKSFNFYPKKSQHESSTETQYHQNPLEVAATQYVFNQSLDYQHFDSDSTNSDNTHDRFQQNGMGYDFDRTRRETRGDTGFDFDPSRQDSHEDARFDFELTRQDSREDTGFCFESTQQDSSEDTGFDFDPTRQQISRNTGFNFESAVEENADEFQSLDEVYSKLKTGRHDRTQSEGNIRQNPPLKMKKSTSLKVGFSHFEEEEIVEARRPATVREKKPALADDVEVDSRADDFINKFKNDLKLQRIESIIRTKGTTNRGTGK